MLILVVLLLLCIIIIIIIIIEAIWSASSGRLYVFARFHLATAPSIFMFVVYLFTFPLLSSFWVEPVAVVANPLFNFTCFFFIFASQETEWYSFGLTAPFWWNCIRRKAENKTNAQPFRHNKPHIVLVTVRGKHLILPWCYFKSKWKAVP